MATNHDVPFPMELLDKSREAALSAVQTFNNPLTTFKTETFIVLMTIAWTYLLHTHYERKGIDYRYYNQKEGAFVRTKSGAFKYWELERCLKEKECPLDGATISNLRFLIGLRNEIEHHRPAGLDEQLSGRYLACCLNYERYICELFGEQQSLDESVAFTLQFRDFATPTTPMPEGDAVSLPSNIAKYLQEFDAELPDGEIDSPYFRRRFLFVPVVTSKKAQADRVIEFIPADSELGESINAKYHQVILKEVERPKHLPSEVWQMMQREGYTGFKQYQHTTLWKELDAKNPGKGYGVQVTSTWYWYDRWVDEVRNHCEANKSLYVGGPQEEIP